MVRLCVFPQCPNKMTGWTKFSFHRLPLRNLDLLKLWLVVLKMDPNTEVEALRRADHRVCSAHFASEDFFPARAKKKGQKVQRLNLRKNAAPMVAEGTTYTMEELHFRKALNNGMMQAGVCLRQDTETTLPELTEQHRIRLKEEELSGLESVNMAESERKYSPRGLSTLEPECVTAHSGVSNVHHTDTSLIKTETDLVYPHTGDLKTESLEFTELISRTRLHPDQIKTETDDGDYLQAEHNVLQDVKCVVIKSEEVKFESSDILVSDLTVLPGAGDDLTDQTEPWQCAGEPNPNSTTPGEEQAHSIQHERHLNKPSKLTQNQGAHTGEKRHQCSQCGKSFLRKSCLNSHQRIHKVDKPYMCTLCGKSFNRKSNLSRHQGIHAGEKPYKCDFCEKSFLDKSYLNIHKRIHRGEKPHMCIQCGKGFLWKCNLIKHQKIHTDEKPYKCDWCAKLFLTKSSLNIHHRIHAGKTPYTCTRCGKCFTDSSILHIHQRIHTGEKPYSCTQCGQSFSTKSALKVHQRAYAGERPFRCTQCEKCFVCKSQLTSHQRVHTGEKPYTCTQCDKCYTTKPGLTKHQRIHTDRV